MSLNTLIQNYWPLVVIAYAIYEIIIAIYFLSSLDESIRKQMKNYPKHLDLIGKNNNKRLYYWYSQMSPEHLKVTLNDYETRLNRNYTILTITDLIVKIAFPVTTFFYVSMITILNNFMQSSLSVAREVKDEIKKFEKLTTILEQSKENSIDYMNALPSILSWFAVIFLLALVHILLLNQRKNMYQSRIGAIKLVLSDKKELGDRPVFNTNHPLKNGNEYEDAIFYLIPVSVWDQDKLVHTGIVKSHTEQDVYVDNERYSKSIYQFKTK